MRGLAMYGSRRLVSEILTLRRYPLPDRSGVWPKRIRPIAPEALWRKGGAVDFAMNDTPARIGRIWSELLPGSLGEPDADFFAAGGHSLLATRLLSRIERECAIKIPLPQFYRDPTLGAIVNAVQAEPPARQFRFDRVARLGRGTEKPVFAVMHSNGAFFPVGQDLGAEHPFVALQAVDRRTGGRLPTTVEAIAEGYVQQLRAVEPDGPYVLLGWCLAGNVAYEAAQQLRAAGQDVRCVIMVDTWNPAYLNTMGKQRRKIAELSYGWQIILTGMAKVMRGMLPLVEFLRARNATKRLVRAPVAEDGPLSPAAKAYLEHQAFDMDLQAQLHRAAQLYRPRPFDGRLLHIRSSEEPRGFGLDRRFGWGRLVGKGLQMVSVPGDHLTIFMEPSIASLIQQVRAAAR
jgi:thioesterase domain-containing protein